jgi:hypothetical protein
MENTKENDWLVSIASNEGAGLEDYYNAGLTAENTQFLDRDYYKSKRQI